MVQSREAVLFVDEDEMTTTVDGFDSEPSQSSIETSFQKLMNEPLLTDPLKNGNFEFFSLQEVVQSQGIDQTKWQKESASFGGDVLKKETEEGKREWVYKSSDGKETSITNSVAGKEIETRHMEILDELYTKGFAISEFQKDATTIAKEIYFADSKGNITFEVYFLKTDAPILENSQLTAELDDGDDNIISGPTKLPIAKPVGLFSLENQTPLVKTSSETAQKNGTPENNVFNIFSSKQTEVQIFKPSLFKRLAVSKPKTELLIAQDTGIEIEINPLPQDFSDNDGSEIFDTRPVVKNLPTNPVVVRKLAKTTAVLKPNTLHTESKIVLHITPALRKLDVKYSPTNLLGITIEASNSDEISSEILDDEESQPTTDIKNGFNIPAQKLIPILVTRKTAQRPIANKIPRTAEGQKSNSVLAVLRPQPEKTQAIPKIDSKNYSTTRFDRSLSAEQPSLGIELASNLESREVATAKSYTEQYSLPATVLQKTDIPPKIQQTISSQTFGISTKDAKPIEVRIQNLQVLSTISHTLNYGAAKFAIPKSIPKEPTMQTNEPLSLGMLLDKEIRGMHLGLADPNTPNWTIREHFTLPSFVKTESPVLIPKVADITNASEQTSIAKGKTSNTRDQKNTLLAEKHTTTPQTVNTQSKTEIVSRPMVSPKPEKVASIKKEPTQILPIKLTKQKVQIKPLFQIKSVFKPAIEIYKNSETTKETAIRSPILEQKEQSFKNQIPSIKPKIQVIPLKKFTVAFPLAETQRQAITIEDRPPEQQDLSANEKPTSAKKITHQLPISIHNPAIKIRFTPTRNFISSNATGISLAEEQELFDYTNSSFLLAA